MTLAEVARVLAKASAFDLRTVGEADVLAWHEIFAFAPFEDSLAAVTRHYTRTTDRLMPAHLVALLAEMETERRKESPDCPDHPGSPAHNCGGCRADRLVKEEA